MRFHIRYHTLIEIERKGYMVNIFTPVVNAYIWRPGRPFALHIAFGHHQERAYWRIVK